MCGSERGRASASRRAGMGDWGKQLRELYFLADFILSSAPSRSFAHLPAGSLKVMLKAFPHVLLRWLALLIVKTAPFSGCQASRTYVRRFISRRANCRFRIIVEVWDALRSFTTWRLMCSLTGELTFKSFGRFIYSSEPGIMFFFSSASGWEKLGMLRLLRDTTTIMLYICIWPLSRHSSSKVILKLFYSLSIISIKH